MNQTKSANFNSALQECAMECALRRLNKKCRIKFGSPSCDSCRYYISNYIDADRRHRDLYMLQAENKAAMLKVSSRRRKPVLLLLTAVCLFFAFTTWLGEQQRINRRVQAPQAVVRPQETTYQRTIRQINETLDIVANYMRRGVDVNRDGLVNCIDAAVIFFQYFPVRENVTISVNRHPTNGFHHLFNVVLVDGVWRAVEPQARFGGKRSFWMRDVWPTLYDPQFNRVVTNDYLRYVRRR